MESAYMCSLYGYCALRIAKTEKKLISPLCRVWHSAKEALPSATLGKAGENMPGQHFAECRRGFAECRRGGTRQRKFFFQKIFAECQGQGTRQRIFFSENLCRVPGSRHSAKRVSLPSALTLALGKEITKKKFPALPSVAVGKAGKK